MVTEPGENYNPTPRDRILDAASSTFAEAGFAGARVDEIARRAGVNKAMLYYHIGDKEALYTAVLERNFDRAQESVAQAMALPGTASERLEAVVAAITRLVVERPDHPRMLLREVASGGASLPPEILRRMMWLVAGVGGLLAEGVAAGEFRATDPVLTHLTMIGAVLFVNATAPLRERAAALGPEVSLPEPGTDVAAFLCDLLLNGIAATPRTGGNP